MKIEKAIPTDHEILTEITKKSKAFWGYSEELLLKWSDNLTVTSTYIESNNVFKLIDNNLIMGYYSYLIEDEKTAYLDNMFIAPEKIGKGFGKFLINDFLHRMKAENFEKITLHSEPNAEIFYQKMGFIKVGEFETSIKNRFMPIMEMKLQ